MPHASTWPYAEVTPDEYLDRPRRTAPGQATPPPATPRTPEERAAAAARCRTIAAEHRARAAELRAKGDGHRVWALAAESDAATYERMANTYDPAPETQP